MLRGLNDLEKEFGDALMADLGKCPAANLTEVSLVKIALEHDLKHLHTYMKDLDEETELLLAPAKTMIRYEPLGVVAVYSAWNYPILLALKPVV